MVCKWGGATVQQPKEKIQIQFGLYARYLNPNILFRLQPFQASVAAVNKQGLYKP